jgi:hypothetical protein
MGRTRVESVHLVVCIIHLSSANISRWVSLGVDLFYFLDAIGFCVS